jgi:hypothetical protein
MISDDVLDIKKEPPDSRPGTAVHQDGPGAVTLNLTDGVTLKQPELESNNSIPMGDIEHQPQPVGSDENMVNLPGSGENISKIPGSQSPDGNKTNLFNRPSSRIETMRRETRSMYETFRPSGVDILTDRQRSFDILSGRRKSAAAAFHLASERESESFVGGGFAGDDDFMEVQENQENIPPVSEWMQKLQGVSKKTKIWAIFSCFLTRNFFSKMTIRARNRLRAFTKLENASLILIQENICAY